MTATPEILSSRSRWAIAIRVGVMGTLITMASQFYRNAHVVVAPDIMRDVGVSAQLLGLLSAGLFLTAAAAQVPAGVLIDIHGPRRTIPVMLFLVILGAVFFATATSGTGLVVGRLLMGVGVAALGMASIVACARWFAPEHFGTVVGAIIGLSQIGNVVATLPLALVSEVIGWRNTYLAMTAITAILGILSYLLIRDAPPDHPYHKRQPESIRNALGGIREVLAVPGFVKLLAIAFTAYAVVSCILGLWGGPYLHDVHGLDTIERGRVLLWFAVGMIVGNIAIGSLDRIFDSRKYIVIAGATATICALLFLAVFPAAPILMTTLVLAGIGFSSGYTIVIIVHGRGFYPDRLMGRGVTVVNTAVLAGAGVMQGVTGLLTGMLEPGMSELPTYVYQVIFATLALVLSTALAVYSTCPDKKRSKASI